MIKRKLVIAALIAVCMTGCGDGKTTADKEIQPVPTATPFQAVDYSLTKEEKKTLENVIGWTNHCSLEGEMQGVPKTDQEKLEFLRTVLWFGEFVGIEKRQDEVASISVEDAETYVTEAFGSGIQNSTEYDGMKLRNGSFICEEEIDYHVGSAVEIQSIQQVSEHEVEVKGLINQAQGDCYTFDWFTATFVQNEASRFAGLTMTDIQYNVDFKQNIQKAYFDFMGTLGGEQNYNVVFAQDLNQDGIPEVFLGESEEGTLYNLECYTLKDDEVVQVDTKVVGNLAEMDYIGYDKESGQIMLEKGEYSEDALYLANYYIGIEENQLVIKDQFSSYDYSQKEDQYYHGSEVVEHVITERDYFSLYEEYQNHYQEILKFEEEYGLYSVRNLFISSLGESVIIQEEE